MAKRSAQFEELIVLGLAAALVSLWLGLWLGWLLRLILAEHPGPALVPVLLFAMVIVGARVTHRALQQPKAALPRTRLVVGAVGAGLVAGATVLTFPLALGATGQPWYLLAGLVYVVGAAVPAFLGYTFAWWTGIRLGRAPVGHHILAGVFYGGVFALALLLMGNTFRPVYAGRDVLLPVLLYFALGLSGLALTSLRRLRAQQRTVALTQVALTRYWVVSAAAVIGLVVFVGLVAAQLLAPESVRQLAALLDAGLRLVLTAVALVITPVFLMLFALLGPLGPALARAALALLNGLQRLADILRNLMASLLRGLAGSRLPRLLDEERIQQFINSPAVQASGRWGLVLAFLLVALVVFWLAVRRLGRRATLDGDEIRDSVFSMPLLLSQLRRLFQPARRRSPAPSRYLPLAGAPDDARLIVRRAYQAMLEWAQSASLPRAAGQTPRAYAEVLAGAVPQEREAIGALTSAYLVARYASEAPSLEQARHAESAVARLRQVAPEAVAHA
jgi:hypothetical protein